MTELIELVQKQTPGSEVVRLFELTFNSTTLYFHPGLDENLAKLYFEDATTPFKIREYEPFPIEMTGIEFSADGATNRPTLTVANVTSQFSNLLGGLTNEDLIGSTIVVRETLAKYLETSTTYNNNTGNGALPIEFPKKKFILDRLAGENALAITFELSSPYDLENVQLPRRTLVGKYCSWIYQGHDKGLGGGCSWKANSTITYPNGTSGGINSHKAYFDDEDNPIVPNADKSDTVTAGWTGAKGYATYSNSSAIVKGNYYEHNNTVWKAAEAQATTGSSQIAPEANSAYWMRGDVCGKRLSSCKCRYQFVPHTKSDTNSYPKTDKNLDASLPFGSFIGTRKFR